MDSHGEARQTQLANPDLVTHLSYKFQRLREQIRGSILNGEFGRRLPGERELGRRYHANAKTINKALCDLSSEGLLVRHIGRGTFVAKANGTFLGHTRRRRFVCLVPANGEAVPAYRSILLHHFCDRLVEAGGTLDAAVGSPDSSSHDIPLKCWSTRIRSSTAGLVVYPHDPLSGGVGRLGDDCIAEALRRRVPMVSLGGFAGTVRVDAAVPDYVDAGFRLAEYLALLGCLEITVLVEEDPGREAELVMNGCRAAASRYKRPLLKITRARSSTGYVLADPPAIKTADPPQAIKGDSPCAQGLICVGIACLQTVLKKHACAGLRVTDSTVVSCVLEPGDTTAQTADVTAYEVDPRRIGVWGADLILEAKPGQTPIEVAIPGELKIRGAALTL